MTERLLYCENLRDLIDKRGPISLDPGESQHARASLRLSIGDAVTLINGRGAAARGRVIQANPRMPLTVQIEHAWNVAPPSATLALIVAIPKGERLDWMIEKCTELGVDELWLADFERSNAPAGASRLDRLERIVRAAGKQCRRAFFPRVVEAQPLQEILGVQEARRRATMYAQPGRDSTALHEKIRDLDASHPLTVAVGPEGGFTPNERALLHAANAQPVCLGSTILRVESAAIAVAAIWSTMRAATPTVGGD